MQTKNDKVIFFDCYQTLLDIRLDKESQKVDEQRGWEEFVNLLFKNHAIKIGASDFVNLLERRKADFYSDKDKTIYHHNLRVLISEVLEKDMKNKLSEDEISFLIYETEK